MIKWLLVVVGVIVAVIGTVTVIGMTLPEKHIASRSTHVSLPPDSLWGLITDVERYPEWRTDVDSVQKVDGAVRLTWREVSGSDRMTYEATEFESPSHFAAHIADKGLPFGGTWDYQIQPDSTGSRLTITEHGEVYNPIFRFVSRYFIGHTATMDKYLTALAARTGDSYVPGAD